MIVDYILTGFSEVFVSAPQCVTFCARKFITGTPLEKFIVFPHHFFSSLGFIALTDKF
jgi:hypothetical protein